MKRKKCKNPVRVRPHLRRCPNSSGPRYKIAPIKKVSTKRVTIKRTPVKHVSKIKVNRKHGSNSAHVTAFKRRVKVNPRHGSNSTHVSVYNKMRSKTAPKKRTIVSRTKVVRGPRHDLHIIDRKYLHGKASIKQTSEYNKFSAKDKLDMIDAEKIITKYKKIPKEKRSNFYSNNIGKFNELSSRLQYSKLHRNVESKSYIVPI